MNKSILQELAQRILSSKSVKPNVSLAPTLSVIVDDYLFEERAAIMEYDGNIPREEAEAQAAIDIKTVKKQ